MSDPSKCVECDLGEIDALTCESARIERQAAVTKESLETLDGYRDKFRTARETYAAALAAARADVAIATKQFAELDLTCKLNQDTRKCIDDLWSEVLKKIQKCRETATTPMDDCKPNSTVGDKETPAALAGRIQVLRAEAARLGTDFDGLVDQQTQLPARAVKAKDDVAALVAASRGEPPANEPARLYIRGKVVEWTLAVVFQGFPSVDSYLDRLCQVLTCILRHWQAIVVLEGALAEKACKAAKEKDTCDALLADPAAELQARYDAKQAEKDDSGAPDGRGTDR